MIYWLVRAQPLFSFPLAQTVRGEPITLSHCGYVLCHLQTLDRDTFTPTTNGWKLKNSDTRRFQNLIPQPLSGGTVLTAKQDIRSWQNNLTTFKSCSQASFGVCPSCHEIVDPWRDCFAHLYFQGQEWTLCKPLIQHGWKVLELFRKKIEQLHFLHNGQLRSTLNVQSEDFCLCFSHALFPWHVLICEGI